MKNIDVVETNLVYSRKGHFHHNIIKWHIRQKMQPVRLNFNMQSAEIRDNFTYQVSVSCPHSFTNTFSASAINNFCFLSLFETVLWIFSIYSKSAFRFFQIGHVEKLLHAIYVCGRRYCILIIYHARVRIIFVRDKLLSIQLNNIRNGNEIHAFFTPLLFFD